MYDRADGRLQMLLLCSGTKEEVLAREGLVLPRANMFANRQAGGGHLRGKSQDELIDLAGLRRPNADDKSPVLVNAPSMSHAGVALIAVAAVLVAGALYFIYRQRKSQGRIGVSAAVPVIEAEVALPMSSPSRRLANAPGQAKPISHMRRLLASPTSFWVSRALGTCWPIIPACIHDGINRRQL